MDVICYRKKPVVIQAVEVVSNNMSCIAGWCGGRRQFDSIGRCDGISIKTLEGDMKADIGDFIIKGIKGEFYPCKPDVFELTYEPTS